MTGEDRRTADAVVLTAIAETLEHAPRLEDDGLLYIVVDDALARQWASAIRESVKRTQA